MQEFSYTIKDPKGIHARPAGIIVKKLREFSSAAVVIKGDDIVDLSKIMPFIGMDIAKGDKIIVRTEGPDEKECAEALKAAFRENL
ncbi:MAG: HPr family phosphocarrier protein [Solobacterium sp.]|nr:HPr family phosphocarrier protein [Solobacterium sp.]